jgi:glycine/serine hydroxymethyltransferase
LAEALIERGMNLITNGTDNHMMAIDTVASFGLDGAAAQHIFDFNRQHGERHSSCTHGCYHPWNG